MRVIADQTRRVVSDQAPGLPIVRAAREFATARHAGQSRGVDNSPFIAHPIEVARLLDSDGQPGEVIAAGLLHDLLETTATTSPELERRFGTGIARLVESVSDDPSIGDYKARKRELRARIAHAGPDTVAIFTADKISKVRELALLPPSRLHEPQARAKLAHYVASLKMLRQVAPDGALLNRLDTELNRLVAAAATGPHNARTITDNTGSNTKHRARQSEGSGRS